MFCCVISIAHKAWPQFDENKHFPGYACLPVAMVCDDKKYQSCRFILPESSFI